LSGLPACAPDAWRPDPTYEAFLDRVDRECPYFQIGMTGSRALFADARFLDATSRLFHGVTNAADWKLSMQQMYFASPGDPGMTCLLSKLPATPVPASGPPVGLTPIPATPTPGVPDLPPPPGN
ncbi:MAG TPA: hypothetical protein VF104_08555, partial [Burkholderiales bacterium]